MSLFVVSLTKVPVTLRPKRRKDTMKPSIKDEMYASLSSTMPKRQLLRDMRRLMKHARLLSARPKEAADNGSEKAPEAWETTKGKAREAAEGSSL